jgi:hypothetical protein
MKGGGGKETVTASFLRFLLLLLLPFSVLYFFYTLHLLLTSASSSCPPDTAGSTISVSRVFANHTFAATATTLQHVVFGIAASSRFWEKRKDYIKVWWGAQGDPRRGSVG